MAKPIIVSLSGKEYSFTPTKIERAKIYGAKKRVALDAQERFCIRASLTSDGAHLMQAGMTAQGYFKEDGQMVSRSEMQGIDFNGKVVETIPSTLGFPQALEGPVSGSEVLNLEIESIYFAQPLDEEGALHQKLKHGEIYKFSMNYSAGLEMETAYLVGNDEGYFALVGKPTQIDWIESATLFEAVETAEPVDDLDFESM
jgi:hypothetical protein